MDIVSLLQKRLLEHQDKINEIFSRVFEEEPCLEHYDYRKQHVEYIELKIRCYELCDILELVRNSIMPHQDENPKGFCKKITIVDADDCQALYIGDKLVYQDDLIDINTLLYHAGLYLQNLDIQTVDFDWFGSSESFPDSLQDVVIS